MVDVARNMCRGTRWTCGMNGDQLAATGDSVVLWDGGRGGSVEGWIGTSADATPISP